MRDHCLEGVSKEGMVQSLQGSATGTVRYLGPLASVDEILSKLDHISGAMACFDILMQDFYSIQQLRL